jgi:predicted DCC family thiol-disulfide oxidoreductase YuxK
MFDHRPLLCASWNGSFDLGRLVPGRRSRRLWWRGTGVLDAGRKVTENYVLYDGACPACSRYIAASGLAGNRDIALINARTNRALVAEHARAGRLIDDGMVVVIDGVIHYGADATRKIGEIGRPAGPAQRILLWIVGKAPWANALYPALAAGRRGLLRLLGRSLIGP